MSEVKDLTPEIQDKIKHAIEQKKCLNLQAGNSKSFYGRMPVGEPLTVSGHRGITSYEPTDLVLTARAGTPVSEIDALLAEHGQSLSFDPPQFSTQATLGGSVASGLAGPGRPWLGAPRDMLLGAKLLDGKADVLSFGGQVMKNVAGYDLSRLMAGSMGTLGVLLELSIKVLPRPQAECSLVLEQTADQAISLMRKYATQPAPITAAAHLHDRLMLRLSGNQPAIDAWSRKIGGDSPSETAGLWQQLRDHQLPFFMNERPLWRLSLPPATPRLDCEQETLLDWGGAQRWVHTMASAEDIRDEVAKYSGHAILFRHGDRESEIFQPLDPVKARLHRRLKDVFDPHRIFNQGRMYSDW